MSFLTMPHLPRPNLYIVSVSTLISFLAYSSQILFKRLEGPVFEGRSRVVFNVLVVCIWICYYRACTVEAGGIPKDWHGDGDGDGAGVGDVRGKRGERWPRGSLVAAGKDGEVTGKEYEEEEMREVMLGPRY